MEKILFADKLQQTFQLIDADPKQELTLTEVKDLASTVKDGKAFSLLFSGAADSRFEQGVYRIHHQEMDEISLFLVPIGPSKEEGICYEAIFN